MLKNMDITGLAISAGILWAAWKFGPNVVKGGAIAVAGVIVAKQVPYLQDQI